MEQKLCQSCAMPMNNQNLYGTDKDGIKTDEYCHFCFKDGEYTREMTIEQMKEICIPFMKQEGMDEKEATKIMDEVLPTLKRWQK